MRATHPFHTDPTATGVFPQLRSTLGVGRSPLADRGLRAVVIGGGTGAPVSIRTLLTLGVETSAIVTMADDGGSTGILREEADVTPPGDVRKCLSAFARDPDSPLTKVFKYRFAVARDHALGNLLLSGLEDACGSFPAAISVCEKLLDAQGHVFPSTLDRVWLTARTRDGQMLDGQAVASHSRTALESVSLVSSGEVIEAYGPALDELRAADVIVLGPGSLFTSIIPNLLVPGIIDAIRASGAAVAFICSLADVQGETWGLTAREHWEALCDVGMDGLVQYMLVHTPEPLKAESPQAGSFKSALNTSGVSDVEDESAHVHLSPKRTAEGVRIKPVAITYEDMLAIQDGGTLVIARDLADAQRPTWHSPEAYAEAMLDIFKLAQARKRAQSKKASSARRAKKRRRG